MQTSRLLSFSSNSSSFGSFSSTTVDLAAIAARVVDEFQNQQQPPPPESSEDDFEFAFDTCSPKPIATADEIFCNGQIRPLNPYGYDGYDCNAPVESKPVESSGSVPKRRRPALGKLMSEDRDPTSNSEEAEEDLIGVSPESYCVWTPKQSNEDLRGLSSSPSPNKIKSNSAGFSKRWKLRNLLYARSNSEGNEKLVFPAPVKVNDDDRKEEETTSKEESEKETKRQEFVPYRKDMVGILKNVNGLSRHLRPF